MEVGTVDDEVMLVAPVSHRTTNIGEEWLAIAWLWVWHEWYVCVRTLIHVQIVRFR